MDKTVCAYSGHDRFVVNAMVSRCVQAENVRVHDVCSIIIIITNAPAII